nr:glycosyltransferase family 4 protein [Actinomyces sp.]
MTLIHLASNNGEIGGGEVMLLHLAEGLRDLGHEVHVLGPAAPCGVLEAAAERGFDTTEMPAGRRDYMRALASWDRRRHGILWCNGLVPALATAGRRRRIVHLHQAPTWKHVLAGRTAGMGALALLVPSAWMAARFPGAQILPNWVEAVDVLPHQRSEKEPVILGFLGRLSLDKGVGTLARALQQLDVGNPGRYRLLLAGESRFVDEADQQQLRKALAPIAHLTRQPGWMERADFFSAVDLAVFPSTAPESFGLIVAEAQNARCPYVVSDSGALPEVAGQAYPWVFHAGDHVSLSRRIEQALAVSDSEQEQLLQTQHERWESRFSPTAGAARLRHLLTDVLPQEENA